MLSTIFAEVGIAAAYGIIGLVLMALGFVLIDVLTPGNLREQVWAQRNQNACVLLASNVLGVGIIVATAIAASSGNLATGLVTTAVYGLLGLVLMGLSFLVVDAAVPVKLGATLVDPTPHPGVWVNGAAHISVAAIVSVAIF